MGRGAAATDELCAGALLLGLRHTGQPERRMALERLEEFEVRTLVLVGFESERTDLPLLRDLVASMTSVNLEIIAGADHRLQDAAGRTMTEAVLMKVDAWLHLRQAQRGASAPNGPWLRADRPRTIRAFRPVRVRR